MAADCPMSRTHTLRPGSPARQSGLRRWREGKVRPIPGSSPHDRPVSRVISLSPRRACDDPFHATGFRISGPPYWARSMRFLRHGGIYLVRWGSTSKTKFKTKSRVGTRPPPAGRPRAQAKERAGRNTLFLIVRRMSSGRLFLDRVGRHQSPSPLHRRPQHNMHFSNGPLQRDISTLHKRVTFLLICDCVAEAAVTGYSIRRQPEADALP